jgi:hypothetical protein
VTFKNLDSFHLALFGIPFILATFGLYFGSRPYTYVVRGEATVICDNGKEYPAQANGIDAQTLAAYVQNGRIGTGAKTEDQKAKELCAYGVINDFIPFRNTPQTRNYSVRTGTSVPSLDISQNSGVTLSHE